MTFRAIPLLGAMVAASFLAAAAAPAVFADARPDASDSAPSGLPDLPKRVIVQFTETAHRNLSPSASNGRVGLASFDSRLAGLGTVRMEPVFESTRNPEAHREAGLDRFYVVRYTANLSAEEVVARLQGPEVELVEIDTIMRKMVTEPNDPSFTHQWAIRNPGVFPSGWTEDCDSDADLLWDYTTGDPSMIVAVLDTGVDASHPEFAGRMVPGWDFVNDDDDPDDDDGHGTACAGILAAAGNNGIGVAGVVWNVQIMPVQVLNAVGSGFSSDVAAGVTFAVDNGAQVLSLSLGGGASGALSNAINYCYNQGSLAFCATGNDNASTIGYPARYTNAVAVGSVSPCNERKNPSSCDGETWWGSNYGVGIDFLAPGVLMFTTDIVGNGGYTPTSYTEDFNGTSSATPHAAGIGALLWAHYPDKTNQEIWDLMRISCDDLGTPGYDLETGYGRLSAASALVADAFVDGTQSAIQLSGESRGASWNDYDNDGDPDLLVTQGGGSTNKLFRNDFGVFVDVTTPAVAGTGTTQSGVFGDGDGDGDDDLYLGNDDANVYLRNDGGSFVDATVAPLDDAGPSTTTSWIDIENDGDLDLYIDQFGTNNTVLLNDGTGTFTDGSVFPLNDPRFGQGLAWSDMNNDGFMDLYIANENLDRAVLNNGDGTFSSNFSNNVWSAGVAFADVDNDGDMDFFLAVVDESDQLWLNDGTASFSESAMGLLPYPGPTTGVAWADVDLDGWIDLLVTRDGEQNRIYRNEEGVDFSPLATTGPTTDAGNGRGIAWADYDGDGDLDYYVANAGQANVLVRNDQDTGNHWLEVRLNGDVSNERGVGCRVRVVTGSMSQIRDVDSGGGYHSQNEKMAHFGLGSNSMADSLIVAWPSGTVDIVTGVSADQRVLVNEGGGVVSVDTGDDLPSASIRLAQNTPNPFVHSTFIRYQIEQDSPVRLRIFTADGRAVRTLVDGEKSAGPHIVAWDRRDASGRDVPAGVYFYQLEAEGRSEARRMITLE